MDDNGEKTAKTPGGRENTDTPPPEKKPRRKKHRLRRLAAAFLLLLLLCVGGVYWLLTTAAGLHTAFFRLPEVFGVHIRAENVRGTLWDGFAGENWEIRAGGQEIRIRQIVLDWSPGQLRRGILPIRELGIGEIKILSTGQDKPPRDTAPARLPENIGLPFDVVAERIHVGRVLLGKDESEVLSALAAQYRFQNNRHTLDIETLQVPWGSTSGSLNIENAAPFPLSVDLATRGFIDGNAVAGNTRLSGSLQTLKLQTELEGLSVFFSAEGDLSPFAGHTAEKLNNLHIHASHFNPRAFFAGAPAADIFLIAELTPHTDGQGVSALLSLVNAAPAAAGIGIPLGSIQAQAVIGMDSTLTLNEMRADFLHNGVVEMAGKIGSNNGGGRPLDLSAKVQNLTAADITGGRPVLPANGVVRIGGSHLTPEAQWQFGRGTLSSEGHLRLDLAAENMPLEILRAQFNDGQGGSADISGSLQLGGAMAVSAALNAQKFNPGVLGGDFPKGFVNGKIGIDGQLAQGLALAADIAVNESNLSEVPFQAAGKVVYREAHIDNSQLNIRLGPNRIQASGSLGRAADRMKVDIDAPALRQFGFGLQGAVRAEGFIAGGFTKLHADLKGTVADFALGNTLKMQHLDFVLLASPDLAAPLKIDLAARNLSAAGTDISAFTVKSGGTLARHTLDADAVLTLDKKNYRAQIAAQGGLDADYVWTGTLAKLNLEGALNVLLQNPLRLTASAGRVEMGAARWQVLGGSLHLTHLNWQKSTGLNTRGTAQGLRLGELEEIFALPVKQDLVLDADWDIRYAADAGGHLNITRVAGDMVLPGKSVRTLGLEKLTLATRLQAGRILNTLNLDTRFGAAELAVNIAQKFGGSFQAAPLDGHLKIDSRKLDALKYFLPVGMDMSGSLNADIAIGGTVGDPLFTGTLTGENLSYQDLANGIVLGSGSLNSRFDGRRWILTSLLFREKGENHTGELELSGDVGRVGFLPLVALNADFRRFPVQSHPDRKVVLSGRAQLGYAEEPGLSLTGELKLDEALLDFPKSGAPSLDDDVVVVGREKEAEEAAAPVLMTVNLGLDLNDAFRFSGKGLDVLMGGKLTLAAKPQQAFQMLGTVHVVEGRYKAYGQDLEITRGQITFNGPIANPALNIRALRRMSPVGAGVEVSGTVDRPRLILLADTAMSDKDKLSWLVLGRASAGESDEAALAAVAATWLAGGVNDRIGLVDDIGMTSRQTRNAATGEMNPAEQMVTVGKHLTGQIYIGYEYGISSAAQAVKLIYRISKSIQLIGRVGTDTSGGEVRYSRRFD